MSPSPRDTATGVGAERASPGGAPTLERIESRLKLSTLWISLLFVFAYVDLFSLYRHDVRADIARGELAGFEIGPGFLLCITLYILPAALMICLSLSLAPRVARAAHLGLAPIYAVTIAMSAIGEPGYYLLASGVELSLLGAIFGLAWAGTGGAAATTGNP